MFAIWQKLIKQRNDSLKWKKKIIKIKENVNLSN